MLPVSKHPVSQPFLLRFLFLTYNLQQFYAVYYDYFPIASTGPNIALNKTTEQSPGVYGDGTSDKAVDGNRAHTIDASKCTHTDWYKSTTEAWWRVDLDDTFRLTGVKIYNRNQECMLTC